MNTYNKKTSEILEVAEKEMFNCHHPYVGTEHLFLSLLKIKKLKNIFKKYNLDYNTYKEKLLSIIGQSQKESKYILYTPLLKLVLNKAQEHSKQDNQEMDEYYLLNSLLTYKDGIGCSIINKMGIDLDALTIELNQNKNLKTYGKILNDETIEKIYKRDKEIDNVIEILLRKNKNNPLLVGPAGCGKSAIVYELARRIKQNQVPKELKNKIILSISCSELLSGTKYRGEFEEKINNLIKECQKNKNIILFIDEIHTIIKTGASEGSIDAGNILKPYLANGEIKVIGATTTSEYNKYIKQDKALLRRFTKIKVQEPTINETKEILSKIKTTYEKHYNLNIPKEITNLIVQTSEEYFPNQYNPDKSIEILDTICSRKKLHNKETTITKEDIDSLIKDKIKLINKDKIEKIKQELETKYNKENIKNIINIIKDNTKNKHMYLNGDKTKIKIIDYIANKLNINQIKINCQDYQDEYGINKLIGNNYLYDKIEENPYSFIIIDNYDKTIRPIHNYIENIINNGYITNIDNEKLYLNNTIIFIITNEYNYNIGFKAYN